MSVKLAQIRHYFCEHHAPFIGNFMFDFNEKETLKYKEECNTQFRHCQEKNCPYFATLVYTIKP